MDYKKYLKVKIYKRSSVLKMFQSPETSAYYDTLKINMEAYKNIIRRTAMHVKTYL